MDNNYILTLKNITKEFPGVKALDDVTINIERGTIHGLVGENGAGKSTLIKVLAGIYQPNKGEIILDGKPCRFNSPIEARRAGISVVHQENQAGRAAERCGKYVPWQRPAEKRSG